MEMEEEEEERQRRVEGRIPAHQKNTFCVYVYVYVCVYVCVCMYGFLASLCHLELGYKIFLPKNQIDQA